MYLKLRNGQEEMAHRRMKGGTNGKRERERRERGEGKMKRERHRNRKRDI